MSELLAPAGSMESLKAAIANGCDAVYLGMQKFGARAYSENFDENTLAQAVAYAHLRGVKVYVTMNTIVFQNELDDIRAQLDFLNETGVDGVIAQDLAVLEYVASRFEDMEAHCSTQMGIDDLEGALLCKELGARRVVISREVAIEHVKAIREQAGIPVEVFVHGALCVSYSGNCIMSGMTGNRSGNRGRCIGSCRGLYDIVDADTGASLGSNYILSTKDLNTIEHISELRDIDSLKIEGRMKEPLYVANAVSRYRKALDGTATPTDLEKLNRTFNRTYTKGYLFHEDRGAITNVEKPNHHGYRIGEIAQARKGTYRIALTDTLRQHDIIRIRHENEDVNLAVTKLYDKAGRLISGSDDSCFIKVREKLSVGDPVFKTKDVQYEKELEATLTGEFRRFPLDYTVYAYPGAPLVVDGEGLGQRYTYESDEYLAEALTAPTTADAAARQLARLNDTVFCLGNVRFEGYNAFIPSKMLNAARKAIVEHLCDQRIRSAERRTKAAPAHVPLAFAPQPPTLCAFATTQEQYDACKACGIETVYYDNVIPRNNNRYREREGELLIGGLGGIYRYRDRNPFVTDYSLNVVNATSCYELHRLGAKRVTLSYEINEGQLRDLLEAYRRDNGGSPALEMIVYGRAPLLVTRYCPLKKMGQCGTCRTKRYEIRDAFGSFPLLSHDNCDTTVLNGKVLNLLDEMPSIEGVSAFRLSFTTESPDEVRRIIKLAQGKLDGTATGSAFNPKTDTRGYYNKDIL